jgi:uncharacterized protein YbjQ (UPF0145 family)
VISGKSRETNRLTSVARNRAMARLRAAHEAEYRIYYNEELTARGVTPRGSVKDIKAARRERLRQELAELEREVSD